MKRTAETLKETYDALHASAATRQEVLNMTERRKNQHRFGKRMLVAALAAVLVLALAVGAMAASGVFRMNIREAEPGERFDGPISADTGMPYYWDGAKLVFTFDGPETCSKIRFKPAYMPYTENTYFSFSEDGGWFRRISCEGGNGGGASNQPCLIEVRYAPMFVDGGSVLLLYADDVDAVAQETWNEFQITKFQSRKTFSDGRVLVCSYYLMYQPEQGYLITVSSMEDNLDKLEQIAKGLEIEQTGEIISAADWHGHNEFLDCGVG